MSILETKGLDSYAECIEMAYQILLKSLTPPEDVIKKRIEENNSSNRYRFVVKTTGQNDNIYLTTKLGQTKVFLKSKFLEKKRIKGDLISYYKPLGFYVREPQLQTSENSSNWIIDIFHNAPGGRPELVSSDFATLESEISFGECVNTGP